MIVICYKESEIKLSLITLHYPHHQCNHCYRGQDDGVPILGDEVPQVVDAAVREENVVQSQEGSKRVNLNNKQRWLQPVLIFSDPAAPLDTF